MAREKATARGKAEDPFTPDGQPAAPPRLVGGSFAPPIDDETMKKYEALAADNGGAVGEAMTTLADAVRAYRKLPTTKGAKGTPHPSGLGSVIALPDDQRKELDEYLPWPHEVAGIQSLFDSIPPAKKDLRNAAFHLLWFVKELDAGRQPITNDKL